MSYCLDSKLGPEIYSLSSVCASSFLNRKMEIITVPHRNGVRIKLDKICLELYRVLSLNVKYYYLSWNKYSGQTLTSFK